jgi:hypothetical protein
MHLKALLLHRKLAKAGFRAEDFYAKALGEIQLDNPEPNAWAKAFATSKGNRERAEAAYVKERALNLCQKAHGTAAAEAAAEAAVRRAFANTEQRRQSKLEIEREIAKKYPCSTCAHFTKTGIVDRFKGECSKLNKQTYTSWHCCDHTGMINLPNNEIDSD